MSDLRGLTFFGLFESRECSHCVVIWLPRLYMTRFKIGVGNFPKLGFRNRARLNLT